MLDQSSSRKSGNGWLAQLDRTRRATLELLSIGYGSRSPLLLRSLGMKGPCPSWRLAFAPGLSNGQSFQAWISHLLRPA